MAEPALDAYLEQKLSDVLQPLYKLFRVKTLEDLLKRLIVIVLAIVLLVPLVLLPTFFFIYSSLHLTFLSFFLPLRFLS
jgi:hypothetical protein